MRALVLWTVVLVVNTSSISTTFGQEVWSGRWREMGSGQQSGELSFTLTDGVMDGQISHGPMVGRWLGQVFRDGQIAAVYAYSNFSARAVGRLWRQMKNKLVGHLVFVDAQNSVIGEAAFGADRVSVINRAPLGTSTPASGMFAYCAAPSICGERGRNVLPGNWSWTSQLFSDIKRSYPQVWCNLYPGSC